MGENNSSVRVVKPVFDELINTHKIGKFLQLVLPKDFSAGEVIEICYAGNPSEKVLAPRDEFLNWCRENPDKLKNPVEARKRLADDKLYKFEGHTHPDIYIETQQCYVGIEAKWTEPDITTHTTWRDVGERDQLIRHMDALIGAPYEKPVFGLFIIDANGKISADSVLSRFSTDEYIMASVPHRINDNSWKELKKGFCGVWTWQKIRDQLELTEPTCIV